MEGKEVKACGVLNTCQSTSVAHVHLRQCAVEQLLSSAVSDSSRRSESRAQGSKTIYSST